MPGATVLRDASGAAVALGSELGKGGEGTVFEIQGRPDSVAKVYLKPPSKDVADKLTTMVAKAEQRVLSLAAWPTTTVHTHSGAMVGFVMPKVAGHRPVFQLYGPKLRLQQFPRADWRFLIAAAANTARAFSVIHQAGHVAGDVNHGNLMVSQNATVRMIDCDSFQVTDGGRRWFCEVGVGTHQPPEMQGLASYKGIVRTPNHDNFGLAVIIFQLLCMARHPFSGKTIAPGEPPSIEEAIQSFRYAYSRDQSRTRMAPPPGSLAPEALGSTIQAMFDLAFGPSVIRGGRPTADQWVGGLKELGNNLRQCRANAGHWHLGGLPACPWCDIEAKSGFALFPAVFIGNKAGSSGIVLLWQQVTALRHPGPLPPLPATAAMKASASPKAVVIGARRTKRRLYAAAVAILGLVLAFLAVPPSLRLPPLALVVATALALFYWPMGKDAAPFKEVARATRSDWAKLKAAWSAEVPGPSFATQRLALEALKQQHDALPSERARRLQTLGEARQQSQLAEHLDRFQLASAKINGVGKAKVATLQAHQIFTAGDIDPMGIHAMIIPGFGAVTKGKLVDWRRACERAFRFDSNRGIAPADIAAVESDIARRSIKIEQDMAAGLAQLRAIVENAKLRRHTLEGQAAELLPRLAQAEADARAVGV